MVRVGAANEILFVSGSLLGTQPQDKRMSIKLDPDDNTSIMFTTPSESLKAGIHHERVNFYISSSGQVGIGTKEPESPFDVRDNTEDAPSTGSARTEIYKQDKGSIKFGVPITSSMLISASGDIMTSANLLGSNIGPIYDNYIYFTPADFYADGNPDVRAPHTIGDNGAYLADGSRLDYHAMAVIPNGYKATHAVVYDNNPAASTYTTYSSSIGASGGALTAGQAGGSTATNTEADITDITGGSGVYCVLIWNPALALNRCYGGRITLAKT